MREGGLALTQLATHSAKLSIKAVVKVRGGGEKKKKEKNTQPFCRRSMGCLFRNFTKA